MRTWLIASLALAACGDPPLTTPPQCVDPPTFSRDIKPISDRACVRCHDTEKVNMAREGAPEGLNFNAFAMITDPGAFADSITSGRQPPASAMITTTAEEKKSVSDWRTCGYLP